MKFQLNNTRKYKLIGCILLLFLPTGIFSLFCKGDVGYTNINSVKSAEHDSQNIDLQLLSKII